MVKPLHSLEMIAARMPGGDGQYVECGTIGGSAAVIDPCEATIEALAAPIEYPPLAASIVTGDHVAIAVDGEVPCATSIVRGVVMSLASAGVEPSAISVVVASKELAEELRRELGGNEADGLQIVLHDPDDEAQLCFVGLMKHSQQLAVNRAVYDADVVLSVGVPRPGGGEFDSLFPQLSTAAVIDKHRTPANLHSAVERKARRRETREAGWLIGAAMAIQVVAGPGESVTHVLAGEPTAVGRRGVELYREAWTRRSAQPVSLAIATVTGGQLAQTWQNVAKATLAATRMLGENGGAIAVCTNLDQSPGESLGRLIGAQDLDRTRRKLFHEHTEDSWAAWQLARAISRGPVYLLSRLDDDQVEELGLAPIADVEELARLAGRQESFTVLNDAQHVIAGVEGENADV